MRKIGYLWGLFATLAFVIGWYPACGLLYLLGILGVELPEFSILAVATLIGILTEALLIFVSTCLFSRYFQRRK